MGKSTHRVIIFLLLNVVSLMIMLALFWHFHILSIFVLSGFPIISCGWFFPRRFILFSALFLFAFETIGLGLIGISPFTPQTMLPGIISNSIFLVIGNVLNFTRAMSLKIQLLNEKLSEKNRELESLSFHDPLTNLHNRRYVWEFISHEALNFTHQMSLPEAQLRSLSISDKTMVVIIVDLDYFKQVNDQYGHDVGDQILIQVAKRLSEAVRFDDVVVRWGGEEFLILCPLVHKERVKQVVNKVYNSVNAEPIVIQNDLRLTVTASMGAIPFPPFPTAPHCISFEQCVILADKALYASKEAGRNQVRMVQITADPDEICNCRSTKGAGTVEIDARFLNYVML